MSIIVEAVVGKLGEALVQPIIQEASFLHGVAEKIQLLQDEFRAMRSFLEDADAKQVDDRRVKNWVHEVREVAREAEDAIDIFDYRITPAVRQQGFGGELKRCAFKFTKLKALRDLGRKIERINVKVNAITRRTQTYGIQSITRSEMQSSPRRFSSPHVPEPDFVGFEEQLNSLIDQLIKGEIQRCAMSLVGMGGLGKTTLAKKAYNHEAVLKHFSCRAWVSVSQQYSVRELLQSIGRQCSVGSGEDNELELSSKIFDYLKTRTYLVVLDDIWERRAWDDLKDAFPDQSNGSRILLTTRVMDVALYVRSTTCELPFLKEDESWQLFCKKAFPGEEGCPLDLEPIGRKIVNKCRGLPLAIVVMGGLLLIKTKEASEWQKVLDDIHWQFKEEDNRVSEVLSLSYNHLPYTMKPCFLYLAIFPEEYEFPAHKLIRLWAAEGLLQQRGQKTLEEVGEDYLMELISRNLIQVAARSSSGLIESCRIHDLLRVLCLSKAEGEDSVEVHPWSSTSPSACKGLRLTLHGKKASACTYLNSPTPRHLRSIFLLNENWDEFRENGFRTWWFQGKEEANMLERRQHQLVFTSFKMLRVLDLEQVLIREIPSAIGKLVHLRYLRCLNTRIRSLPSSMARLRNLQTLDVARSVIHIPRPVMNMLQGLRHRRRKDVGVIHIPRPVMNMLQGLRHLRLVTYVSSLRGYDGYRTMEPFLSKNLFDIITNANAYIRYEERVGLEHTNKSSLVSELSLIDKSFISASSSSSMLQRPLLTSCHLEIHGRLSKLPDQPCDFPSKPSKLELELSFLKVDPLPLLEKLENLRFLLLDISYVGKEMACSAGGFPQLQSLHLRELYNLEGWRVEEGAMPCLSDLRIMFCYQLEMLPEGLQHLTKLKTLEIEDMPPPFIDRIRAEVGEDWHKIQHIPSIKIGQKLDDWSYIRSRQSRG